MLRLIDDSKFGRGLVANREISTGEVILDLRDCARLREPTRYSVYVGGDVHIDDPVLSRLNHACRPNVHVDIESQVARTVAPVAPGAMLSFFYPSTEWAMRFPFMCGCGDRDCIGLVVGAAFTAPIFLAQQFLNPHIRDLLSRPDSRDTLAITVESTA